MVFKLLLGFPNLCILPYYFYAFHYFLVFFLAVRSDIACSSQSGGSLASFICTSFFAALPLASPRLLCAYCNIESVLIYSTAIIEMKLRRKRCKQKSQRPSRGHNKPLACILLSFAVRWGMPDEQTARQFSIINHIQRNPKSGNLLTHSLSLSLSLALQSTIACQTLTHT